MATVNSIKVWDPGLLHEDVTNIREFSCQDTDIDDIWFKRSQVNPHYTLHRYTLSELILKYEGIWRNLKKTSYLPIHAIRRYELERCEEELLEQSVRLDYFDIPLGSIEHKESITILLHIYHVFSVPGQEKKKSWVIRELTIQLAKKSEYDLYNIYNEYIDQLMTRCTIVTDKNLCIREIHPYYELQLKLCYGETIMKQNYIQHKNFMLRNVEFVMSRIKDMITRKEYKTMSKSCLFLLHFISKSITIWHQPGRSQNQEELICLLTHSLSMLPQGNFNGIFKVYLKGNSMLELEKLCASLGKADLYLKLNLILVYCENLIKLKHNQMYRKWMVQNLKLFIDLKIKVVNSESSFKTISNGCDKSRDQMNTLWTNEGYRIKKLLDLLSRLLCLLPDDELYETISHYLFLVKNMKSDITPDYLHSVKADQGLKKLFKLFSWRKLITEGHADSNIVNRYINYLCSGKWLDNKAECMAHIIIITDNLPEKSFTKELLQCFLKRNIQTVTSMQTTGDNGWKWNSAHAMSKRDLMYTQCASILSGKKMKNVDIKQYSKKLNMKGPEDENESETQSEQVKLLILFILLLVTALGHKSAKLKKYLALKYEYDMASLYLLWCSGDIEVHPGPPWRKKQLEHDSERVRKWLQDINSILLKLYWGKPTNSKPKNLWQKEQRPKEWPSDQPFYDTKNASKDAKGNKITDNEILTCLLECLKKKEVDISQIYQSEISAWTNKNIQLLHKLQVLRIGTDNAKSAILNLLLVHLEYEVKSLKDIKVSFENSILNEMKTENLLKNDQRQKKQAEIVADIIRDLISKLCRLSRGKDLAEKCDGIWNHPAPEHWPNHVPFFNPYNRGKSQDTCRDSKLLTTFLQLPHMKIPENLKQIVDAYKNMFNCTDIDVKKKNKDELCRLYTIQSNLAMLDCSLQYLHKEGLFSREVHAILNQWWKTQSVDEHAEHVLKNAIVRSDERPHITIDISKVFEPDANLRYISYTIPIKDDYLHIKCTPVHPNQSSHEQTITGPLITANNSENIEDSVIPPDVIDFVLEHDFVNQTKCPGDNSVMNADNRPITFDLQRQVNPFPVTHQHLKPHNDLDTLTTHNTLESDVNDSRCTTEYDATSLKACDSVHTSNSRNGENLGGNMGTSKVKRKQLEDDEEPVKKLLKTKVNQFGHYNRTDEEISSPESKNDGESLEPNHIRTSNQTEICNDNVPDSASLDFSLSDRIGVNGIGDKCYSKSSEDSETFQQICDLESINNSNQQDSLENINELKNKDNQMDQTEDKKELEKCLEMIKYLSR